MKSIQSLLFITITLLHCLLHQTICECLTERDLDFEACDLVHLSESALSDICDRIGLDLEGHVLPALVTEIDEGENEGVGDSKNRDFTHHDYVRGAEECLMIEDEMIRLQDEDPDLIRQLEREALEEDPDTFADMITQIISNDKVLLKEITEKLAEDEELMADAKEMLEMGETLETRPDVIGFLFAKYLAEDPSLLDEFDELFGSESELYEEGAVNEEL
eukprot:scaffold6277_cov54-Cyclotella_meneghiniana.AAC.3